jgi:ribosomal protein S18 acetylase RimI-like enzyme
MTFFKHNNYNFRLSIPEYELPVFGYKVGELRLTENIENENKILPFSEITVYLKEQEIKICTFRGKENIHIIRLFENAGFKFVSTYNIVKCVKEEFAEIQTSKNVKVCLASIDEYDKILDIERTVLDASTFSIDPLIDKNIASKRNAIRVQSHFNKPNHRIYITRINNDIAGFIQFDVDIKNKKADTLNAGIHPAYQNMKIGKALFSEAFKILFEEGCEIITSDYSTQNIGSRKLHLLCNFRIVNQEIHLRYFSE